MNIAALLPWRGSRPANRVGEWDKHSLVAWAERAIIDPWWCFECKTYVSGRRCTVVGSDYLEHQGCGGAVERDPHAGLVLR